MNYSVQLQNLTTRTSRTVYVDAADEGDASAQVLALLQPGESVESVRTAKSGKGRRKLTLDELSDFCLDVADLMEGNRTFTMALQEMQKEEGSKARNELIDRMLKRAEHGTLIGPNFGAESTVVGDLCVTLVKQGDMIKDVPGSLRMVVRIVDRRIRQRAELVKNLAMPVMAGVAAVVLVLAAGLVFIPLIRDLMENLKPNAITRLCFMYSDLLRGYWWVYGPIFLVFAYMMSMTRTREAITGVVMRHWRPARESFVTAREAEFMMLFGALIGGNLTDAVALGVIAQRFKSSSWGSQLAKAAEDVAQGAKPPQALSLHSSISGRTLSTVSKAFSTARPSEALLTGADRAYFRADRAFGGFSRWVTLAALGAVVSVLVMVVIGCAGPIGQMISGGFKGEF